MDSERPIELVFLSGEAYIIWRVTTVADGKLPCVEIEPLLPESLMYYEQQIDQWAHGMKMDTLPTNEHAFFTGFGIRWLYDGMHKTKNREHIANRRT